MKIGELEVYCIKCNEPSTINIDDFDKGQFLVCGRCGTRFNYYGLVRSFYDDIPLAKQIVDLFFNLIYINYSIEGSTEDVQKVKQFLKNNEFDQLLYQIVFDTVLFGTSFIEKIQTDQSSKSRRIDPTMMEVKIEFRQAPLAKAYTEELEKIIVYDTSGSVVKEIPYQNIVLFIGQPSLRGPLGFSVCGFWLHSWFILKFTPKALINMMFRGKGLMEDIVKIKERVEDEIIVGAGMLSSLIKPKKDRNITLLEPLARSWFDHNIESRRKNIASTMGREIFPLALSRPHDFKSFPRFVWRAKSI